MGELDLASDHAAWAVAFDKAAAELHRALGDVPIELHHIGSTSVASLTAKPIIDILGAVPDLEVLRARQSAVEAIGFEAMGAYGIAGRLYFRRITPEGRRTHHLHVFETGSPHITRHIAFRDYLRAFPDVARAYGALKTRLATAPDASWDSYVDGKDAFVKETERAALIWARDQMNPPDL